ncbi:MAG: S41 family peptidase [Alphaproteobacteria bacterium]|nr:S41 family peptidase [Alphaproteobacteria bacterium]
MRKGLITSIAAALVALIAASAEAFWGRRAPEPEPEKIVFEENVRTRIAGQRDIQTYRRTSSPRIERGQTFGEFDNVDARDFYISLFSTINSNFVKNASFADMFKAAVDSLEPFTNFELTYAGGRMLVHDRSLKLLGSYTVPDAEDINGWANTFVNLVMLLRDVSPTLHAMPQPRLYQLTATYILKSLDESAFYFDANEEMEISDSTLGFTWRRLPSGIQVLSILAGSPAADSNFVAGDMITHFNTVPVAKMADEQVEAAISEPTPSVVGINFVSYVSGRPGEVFLRKNEPSFRHSNLEIVNGFPVLVLHNLDVGAAKEIVGRLEGVDVSNGLIIDARATVGGSVDEALELANLFISGGDMLQSYDANGAITAYAAKAGDITNGANIVLLATNTTRGAAETFVFAMDTRKRAVSVGSPTHGEGTERRTFPIHGNRKIQFSTRSIFDMESFPLSGAGVAPLVCQHFLPAVDNLQNFLDRAKFGLFVDNRVRIKAPSAKDIAVVRDLCPASYPFTDVMAFGIAVASGILSDPRVYENLIASSNIGSATDVRRGTVRQGFRPSAPTAQETSNE